MRAVPLLQLLQPHPLVHPHGLLQPRNPNPGSRIPELEISIPNVQGLDLQCVLEPDRQVVEHQISVVQFN